MKTDLYWFIEGSKRKLAEFLYDSHIESPSSIPNLDDFRCSFSDWYFPYHFLSQSNMHQFFEFDQAGVPIKMYVQNLTERSPLAPAYWGLICLNDLARDESKKNALEAATRCGKFLCENAQDFHGSNVIYRNKALAKFHTAEKWYAGISQGLAVSLLLRLGLLHKDQVYIEQAVKFAKSLEVPISEGGVVTVLRNEYPWIEEYPGTPHSHVLNGYIFCLIAISELESTTDYTWTYDTYSSQDLHTSLLTCLPLYRSKSYLKYDLLHQEFCNPHYMGLHVFLFIHLYHLTKIKDYYSIALEFSKSTNWPLYFKSYGLNVADHRNELERVLG